MKWLLAALFSSLIGAHAAGAATDGLVFHLDSRVQPELRQKAGHPAIASGQAADFVMDGSARALVVSQPVPDRRPAFFGDEEAAYLKFDGKDDFLSLSGLSPEGFRTFTLFVLAAPRTNAGGFAGVIAFSRHGRNDYTDGFNLDFGPAPTRELSVLNVETAGAGGFRDLLEPGFFNASPRPFGDFHVFTMRAGEGKIETFLDGFKGGERPRGGVTIGAEQAVIGGRFYSNDPNYAPHAQGFFDGAIAEVLLFDRALSDDERQKVEEALQGKTVPLNALLHGARGHALETVKDAPPVQMLVPGFVVEELPIKLRNLNNVRYRHDGKLVGLGYDGRIHLLSDSDGDGLEDRSELFWDKPTLQSPIGMELTGKNDPRGEGLFVASKGKVSFIIDHDGDGRGDEEKILATGWPVLLHGVDTLGLAVDPKDGSIYFGLGCKNFVDAYLRDPGTGRSQYSLEDIHGTIQRISGDFSTRETICTGVRFTCALAFNDAGDLFATDQEGATWLPNGNPMDELLHIQKGKHYGFPPRHPRHLPNVIDEPAVSEYGPQHQSTVGMVFNRGVNGGPHFGPEHWAGDALVCGESRGKIWRTKLAKTAHGYVAENHLIACLGLLTVDACVSPAGDLVVACHSGPPDWGTGPAGEGRLFRIRYVGRETPQPVRAWAAGPDEFRVSFDRPLDPAEWAGARERVRIEAGQHVGAGDRFEVIRPGYQVVRDQMALPRRWVPVLGLAFTEDNQTLVLRVPRQTEPVNYAITLPLPEGWRQSGGIPQHPEMDLQLALNGVAATVQSPGGETWRTVLPHPELKAAAAFMKGSAEGKRLAAAADARVTIDTQVDASNPFVPVVQPGSKLDWDMASDPFASATFTIMNGETPAAVANTEAARKTVRLTDPSSIYLAREDLRHPVHTTRVFVPWAVESRGKTSAPMISERTDVKGNWLRGRRLYFKEVGCATCHTVRGEGIAFGPDLSNLIHRDRESVLQDVLQPSATINPDHTGTLVTLSNGVILSGLMRESTADKVTLLLPGGAEVEVARADVQSMEPMKTSLMPDGLLAALTDAQIEDLLTFLLTQPLEPTSITRLDPPKPPARRITEVMDVVGSFNANPAEPRPLRILLCGGPKDHGVDEHDYPLWLERWTRLLSLGDGVTVTSSMGFPGSEQLAAADVAVFYNANPQWDSTKAAALDSFHRQGGGTVYVHYAVDGGRDPAGMAERAGLSFTLGSKFRHGDFDLVFPRAEHPIVRGFPTLHFTDESYWNMRGDRSSLKILGTCEEDGAQQPQLWTLERYNARIVGCIPGHYMWTFDDPLFRVLLLRSICWAAKQDNVDRLAELAVIGANVAP